MEQNKIGWEEMKWDKMEWDKTGWDEMGQPPLSPVLPPHVLLGGLPAGTNCHQGDEKEDATRG